MSATPRNAPPAARSDVTLIRLAILVTALAVVLWLSLLIKETAYLFTGFMVLGPALLALGTLLLVVVILRELRTRKVL
jgi:hypothetical protein